MEHLTRSATDLTRNAVLLANTKSRRKPAAFSSILETSVSVTFHSETSNSQSASLPCDSILRLFSVSL